MSTTGFYRSKISFFPYYKGRKEKECDDRTTERTHPTNMSRNEKKFPPFSPASPANFYVLLFIVCTTDMLEH